MAPDMPTSRVRSGYRPSLVAILLCGFMGVLWIAGGASRGDEPGQVIVRLIAAVVVIAALLLGPRPALGSVRPVLWLLAAAILLALLQLVPLPPGVWQALPGRTLFLQAITDGSPQPWRPLAIVPGAAANAAASLVVPLAMLILLTMISEGDRQHLPALVLAMVAAGALLGLLQFAGGTFDNPLINETVGMVGGNFANRNHFALFLALGSLLAPVWAFGAARLALWRVAAGGGLILLFTLIVLGTGSRAGLGLSLLALILGLVLARGGLRRFARRLPRWAMPVAFGGFVALLGIAILASMMASRAVAIDRLVAVDLGQDMRGRGLPVVLAMIREYFPAGSGLGGFDPIFRLHEPFTLLKLTYFNHAHNDFLEVVLDAGLPGLLLLVFAIGWWIVASIAVWRAPVSSDVTIGRLGSGILLLVLVASAFDYPARTPMMMAMVIVAATWLSWAVRGHGGSALPADARHL